jgi:3-hydroxyisobutyrate dehydrogenase
MTKAGVIGLGQIGGGVAICLARAGVLAAVYDVRPDAATALVGVPPVVATPAELARQCDVVLIAVVDAKQIRDVLTGPDGVLAAARPGLDVVLLSTISLPDLGEIRQLTDAAGVGLVDSGVTGGPAAAHNGLVCLVGADDAVLARVRPALEAFAKSVAHMGPPGSGMAAKIARNVIVYTVWRAGYEGARLAAAAGVDVRKLAAAIDASAANVGGPTTWMLRPDPATDAAELRLREATLGLLDKDLAAALALAASLDIDLPMAELARSSARVVMGLDRE